jgi:activating signal cointegrator 1
MKAKKAISLWQPWASAMALGWKRNETRSWGTKYRGPLFIHAAKKVVGWPNIDIQALFDDIALVPSDLPSGAILCKVELIDCEQITLGNRPTGIERLFGDYTPGRYMWITNHLEIFEPIPCKGKQGIFNVELASIQGVG